MSETTSQPSRQILTKRQIIIIATLASLLLPGAVLVNGSLGGRFAVFGDADKESQQDSPKPLPVNVAEVSFVESIQQSRSYSGTVRARHRSDLAFEFPGKIKSVNADEGDHVTGGQILAELDTATLEAQLGATVARLDQAKSLLQELQAGPRQQTIDAARAAVAAAQSLYDNSKLNLQRRKGLRDEGAISFEEYDQALFAEKTAQANLNAAQEQLAELVSGTRPEKVAAQESAVRQLESANEEIEVAISKSKLLAPFAGTVTMRYLDEGSIARASEPVFKLVEEQHLEAWVGLPVSIAADLEIGSRHEIVVDGRAQHGTVFAKILELDPATRTQTVLFELDSAASGTVISGQLCEIKVTSTVDTSGFWIPTSALVKGVRGLW
jgi:multidrug resistance efflux pump